MDTNFTLSPSYSFPKSSYHKSHFWAYLYSANTQHGNLPPTGLPILFCGPAQETYVSHSQHRKIWERFWKKCRWKNRKGRNMTAQRKASIRQKSSGSQYLHLHQLEDVQVGIDPQRAYEHDHYHGSHLAKWQYLWHLIYIIPSDTQTPHLQPTHTLRLLKDVKVDVYVSVSPVRVTGMMYICLCHQ